MRPLVDPWLRSVVLALALAGAGFVALGVAASGASGTASVPEQVAFAVSGGVGGLALVGTGLALFEIQRRRYAAAEERRDVAVLAADIDRIADAVAARRRQPTPTPPTSPTPAPERARRRTLRAR